MSYTFRSYDDLRLLGQQIIDAIHRQLLISEKQFDRAADQHTKYRADPSSVNLPGRFAEPDFPSTNAVAYRVLVSQFVAAEYADIPTRLTAFSVPDPDAAQPASDALYAAATSIKPDFGLAPDTNNGGLRAIPGVTDGGPSAVPAVRTIRLMELRMDRWKGGAADAFNGYLSSLEDAVDQHWQLLISLATILDAQIALKKAMLSDAWQIATLTKKAVDTLPGYCGPNPSIASYVLTTAGIIATIVSAGLSGGTAIAAEAGSEFLTIVGSSLRNTSSVAPAAIGGATINDVVDSMRRALDSLYQTVSDQQANLTSCLDRLTSTIRVEKSILQIAAPATVALRTAGIHAIEAHGGFTTN